VTNRREVRRRAIIEESLKLFSANGFHNYNFPDIAQKLKR